MALAVRTCLRWLGIAIALILGLVAITVAFIAWATWYHADSHIEDALAKHYPGRKVSVRQRDDGPLNQICLELLIRDPATGRQFTRVAMLLGDLDGGNWAFWRREFASMDACKNAYDRG
jgi:hypothetical protein